MKSAKVEATYNDFSKLDIRVGRIVSAKEFPEARKPAFKLLIDFGPEIGMKQSSAQLPQHYDRAALPGKQVLAVINFPPKQIGPFISECLTLGVPGEDGDCWLITPDTSVPNGGRLY